MFACLLLCFISMFACPDLGFDMLYGLHGFVFVGLWGHLLVWLHPSLLWIVWIRPLVGYTSVALVCLTHTLSPLRAMLICLSCLLCAVCLAFFAFSHLLHACLHFHAWVCVSSILQSNGTMDTRSKPKFVLQGHPLLFHNMFVCLFVCYTCLFAPIWHLLLVCLLACFSFYVFLCLSASFFLLSMHVYTWSMDT